MTEIQTAISGIGIYSDALEELNETEKVYLRAELEAKKKENPYQSQNQVVLVYNNQEIS